MRPGAGVTPQVIRAYDGSRIVLPGDTSQVLDPEESEELAARVGHDLVTTDGTTLLGADDKAGVAEIVAAVAYLAQHPEPPRAPVRVAFTVDEEVAGGTTFFELERFGADFAYTLDGSGLGELADGDVLGEERQGDDPRPQRPSGHREGAARQRGQARCRPRRVAAARPPLAGDDRGARGLRPPDADRGRRRARDRRLHRPRPRRREARRARRRSCAASSTSSRRASRGRR